MQMAQQANWENPDVRRPLVAQRLHPVAAHTLFVAAADTEVDQPLVAACTEADQPWAAGTEADQPWVAAGTEADQPWAAACTEADQPWVAAGPDAVGCMVVAPPPNMTAAVYPWRVKVSGGYYAKIRYEVSTVNKELLNK